MIERCGSLVKKVKAAKTRQNSSKLTPILFPKFKNIQQKKEKRIKKKKEEKLI